MGQFRPFVLKGTLDYRTTFRLEKDCVMYYVLSSSWILDNLCRMGSL